LKDLSLIPPVSVTRQNLDWGAAVAGVVVADGAQAERTMAAITNTAKTVNNFLDILPPHGIG
jgi:hypothetical protein